MIRLKKVIMLALSHTILSMSTRTRELSKSTLLSEKKLVVNERYTHQYNMHENTNMNGELGMNHGRSFLYTDKTSLPEDMINLSVTRKILYKDNIVEMNPFSREGSHTQTSK
jgi:hypothetical protein